MKFGELKNFLSACDNSINNTDKKYYKITLDNQEVLITPHRDFAVYMFKFIRELTEYKSDMQIIVCMGTEFKNSYIMSDFATGNKNLSQTLDKVKKL